MNYQRIIANEMMNENTGVIKRGVLNVSPWLFFLLKDEEVKDMVMEQLEIVDELRAGERVEVYKTHPLTPSLEKEGEVPEESLMGYAVVMQYPIEGADGFASVVFEDSSVMSTIYMVRVDCLRPLAFHP